MMDFSRITDNSALTPAEKLHRMTRLQMSALGEEDYIAVNFRVCQAYPELHKEYLDSNGEKYGYYER